MNHNGKITIPSELIGSIPRPDYLLSAVRDHDYGRMTNQRFHDYENRSVQITISELEATGSQVITDGEQTKSSFIIYAIQQLVNEYYTFSSGCFSLTFADGRQHLLPRLVKSPFRHATYAHTYLDNAKRFTHLPIKQAVISPSALSMVYPTATIKNYSHEQFLTDLINETEKEIRLCLEKGAHCVQIDFVEANFALKLDPTGHLLRDFVQLNNCVLERFAFEEQHRLGVHLCAGGDQECHHSFDAHYLQVLPKIFDLHVSNFYLQLASEPDREQVLQCVQKYMQPWHRIFIGVIDPVDPKIETPEEVCERILEAAKYIPIEQLGTTDDCGFAPFDDDRSITRQAAFEKIRARLEGTKMAEERLMKKKSKCI
ncbi:unnamed protein product [Adineta ricciae]|uniref:Cobalamin-independent methionine synthase MetE C-terminal/archaeal domain-containing protein n=1 Tax=Adineta ricciae TaxID=249248 RepID=A0A814Z7W2_ADIRI|nr:unnamed protein product [Adineta ricciae]